MKLNIFILIAIGLLGYALTLYLTESNILIDTNIKQNTNQSVSNFKFTDITGRIQQITDFKGKTIILNFWASWCAPCIKEFPLLLEATRNNPDTVLIALSSDIEESAITKFMTKMETTQKMHFESENIFIAWDKDQAISDKYGIFKLPETLIITPNQTIDHKFIGAEWTAKDLHQAILKASKR